MDSIGKIYVRTTRDEIGRYPNWPVNKEISLGSIGYYHGRKATFEWRTSLSDLGINIATVAPQALISELITSGNSVSTEFHGATSNQPSHARFTFAKSNAIASQGFEMGHQQLPIERLKNELVDKINQQGLNWDYKWVIVTELWVANGFTTLISGSQKGSSVISAKNNLQKTFNIADFNLDLEVTRSKFMSYQGVAEKSVRPYFQIHRLTTNHNFRMYGTDVRFWPS